MKIYVEIYSDNDWKEFEERDDFSWNNALLALSWYLNLAASNKNKNLARKIAENIPKWVAKKYFKFVFLCIAEKHFQSVGVFRSNIFLSINIYFSSSGKTFFQKKNPRHNKLFTIYWIHIWFSQARRPPLCAPTALSAFSVWINYELHVEMIDVVNEIYFRMKRKSLFFLFGFQKLHSTSLNF